MSASNLPFNPLPRGVLDEYLDDGLSPTAKAQVEASLAADPVAARLLAATRADRATRAAAFACYLPSDSEAHAAAEALLAMARGEAGPVGRIGYLPWVRRLSAVAAAALLMVGAFAIGRTTASVKLAPTPTPIPANRVAMHVAPDNPYTVLYWNSLGEPQVRQFANSADVDLFVTDMESRQGGQLASVSQTTNPEESMTLSQEGSF